MSVAQMQLVLIHNNEPLEVVTNFWEVQWQFLHDQYKPIVLK